MTGRAAAPTPKVLILALAALVSLVAPYFTDQVYAVMRDVGPTLALLSLGCVMISAFVLAPLLFLSPYLGTARRGFAVAAAVFGGHAWALSLTLVYELYGRAAAALSLGLFGLGGAPISLLATLSKGYIVSLASVLTLGALFSAALFGATVRLRASGIAQQR